MQLCTFRSTATARSFFLRPRQAYTSYCYCGRKPYHAYSSIRSKGTFPIRQKSHSPPCISSRSNNTMSQPAWRGYQTGPKMEHRAYIALGSNLGDRIAMIEESLRRMEHSGKIRVSRTSSLWETKAMYVLDQDNFVNGVCEVRLV
jgi:hypothetical protein